MGNDQDSTNICKTIYSSGELDPFEGLDLDDICVPPPSGPTEPVQKEKEEESRTTLFDLNPLDDKLLQDLCATSNQDPPKTPARENSAPEKPEEPENDAVNFIIIPNEESDDQETGKQQSPQRPVRSLSKDISRLPVTQKKIFIDPVIERAHRYTELTQIREKIFAEMGTTPGKTLLIASPRDNTGSSFLTAALGYNTACSCQKKVLLIDCNMRRAGLHYFFGVEQSYGFTELIRNNIPWQAVTKETGIENLSMITAGTPCDNFSEYLRFSQVPELIAEVRQQFDLIILDTSPVLTPNRNNVNIVSLTSAVDYFLLVTKKTDTTKDQLKETINVIAAGNGTINGIVLNEHVPPRKAPPYPQK